MIVNKKTHAMKMLQLALALSMLQVDPDSYLYQRLQHWDSPLELGDGDGWELEMLRAVPMAEYPYANRKTMLPLIEDLVHFDRQLASNQHNVTAYLLNVHSDSSNQTAAMQELQTPAPPPPTPGSASGGSVLEQAAVNAAHSDTGGLVVPSIELFINPEHIHDQLSVWEQNLADLHDFGELSPSLSTYAGLPLKEEPLDAAALEFAADDLVQLPAISADFEREPEGAVALNDTAPNPGDATCIKLEQPDNDTEADARYDFALGWRSSSLRIKTKDQDEEQLESLISVGGDVDVDLTPFIGQVELTKEESEIVEVLWKQDVDLGYTLTPSNLASSSADVAGSSSASSGKWLATDVANEDVERLKTLEDLKHDKLHFDAKDEPLHDDELNSAWDGIPFTIDNETGEYIRLPLDDLLNDVLQLADFVDGDESNDDSLASTSKAAAQKGNNRNNSIKSKRKDEEDEEEEDSNDDDDLRESEIEGNSLPSPLFDLDDEANEELAENLDIMIQSAAPPFHHHHHRPSAGVQSYAVSSGGSNSAFHRQATGFPHSHHQGRVPLSRGVSMEQRLQDIASLFNPMPSMGVGVSEMAPYAHYPGHHYAYQGSSVPSQHAQYTPPHPPPPHPHHHHTHHAMLGVDICPPPQPHYGHNLGSAVSSSMHLTNAGHHDGEVGTGAAGATGNVGGYKMEHEMMYYSNTSSEMNHTTDGFINSILNDEDLHLMDMNVNDNFCRMVDVNNATSNNSSVLGISGEHASGGHGGVGSSHVLSMASANGGAVSGGMTSDMMHSAATGGDRLDASSDSAVSSMGSERVPSLSDGEWGEGSDSAQDYHQGKCRGPYDYSYSNHNRINDGIRQPSVAQKKHQMFGKRYLQDQSGLGAGAAGGGSATGAHRLLQAPAPIKYEYEPYPGVPGMPHNGAGIPMGADPGMVPAMSKEMQAYDLKYSGGSLGGGYSVDFSLRPPRTVHEMVQHNHSYTLPQGSGSFPRPQQRDKKTSTSSSRSSKSSVSGEDEHLTRDEKRARTLSIPIPVNDIINLPMDEFNERLSKYDLTENQLSLIRDIRRRGKNKVAAQNCRKRKLDQILSLEDEVKEVRRRKDHLCRDRDSLFLERKRISNKFAALHRHIFQYLRDPEGKPCSPSEYSLQQAADGSVYLLPRDNKADVSGVAVAGASRPPNSGGSSSDPASNHVRLMNQAEAHAARQELPQQQSLSYPHQAQQQQTHPHHSHVAAQHTAQQHPHHPKD